MRNAVFDTKYTIQSALKTREPTSLFWIFGLGNGVNWRDAKRHHASMVPMILCTVATTALAAWFTARTCYLAPDIILNKINLIEDLDPEKYCYRFYSPTIDWAVRTFDTPMPEVEKYSGFEQYKGWFEE
ncbi:uncharacterized protein LOC106153480 [Lingula anatina]|uniref:Uncharacterized protein LOC106153480 n=1 Tax=Lingula anatina TaxID=7574 RepID=A0A1S3HCK1_LINAN|nr:uncharacterized protein LOC106153480 [Lingula anatina]|eukprot:XP_013382874.1 uncharacterized protein LOC106153480 [Lingula anatina]